MVKNHSLLIALSFIFILMIFVSTATAWTGTYHLEQEWVKIWINPNGTIDVFYNISITLDSDDPINAVYVGQPKSDFTIGNATDKDGNILVATDASQGSDYKVKVNLHSPLHVGQTIWFTLTTNVAHMIWEDPKYPGNVGMLFIPTWWEQASVYDLRVLIVLPLDVTQSMVKTTEVLWNNTMPEDDRLAIYWEKKNLSPNQQYPVGVSFPKEYV